MNRQLFFLLLCFSLITAGSGFLNNLNAQTRKHKGFSPAVQKTVNNKNQPTEKLIGIQKIGRERNSGAADDPCTTTAPISSGQTLNGTLANGDCVLQSDGTLIDFYSFNGVAGQPISISMSSSAFDTYLYLLDSDYNPIAQNDDTADGNTDSRIPMGGGVIILPYTGRYIIGANSYQPAVGAYSLTLNSGGANCAAAALNFNQSVNGTLTNADCALNFDGDIYYTDLYTFSGTAGQQITIAMNSTAVDSYLYLDTPSGNNSLGDDDGGGGKNARIPASGTYTLPETGTYTIEASSSNPLEVGAYTLILTGPNVQPAKPAKFDFDGDGKADLSVFRPSNGIWYLLRSQAGFTGFQFGVAADKIVPADFDGDGKTDLAVYRGGTWFIQRSTAGFTAVQFGLADDIPQPADFDGDGKADLAVWRPSTGVWYVYNPATSQTTVAQFGSPGDKPVVGDYNGDGKADYAVFRPSNATWYIARPTGVPSQNFDAIQFGSANDRLVPADYDGDGKTDIAVFRPSNGIWYILNSTAGIRYVQFGISTDLPVPADYDGDGKADVAVYRNGTWYLNQSTNGFAVTFFGNSTDKPIPNAFIQ